MKATTTVPYTGEVLSFTASTPPELVEALVQINAYIKAYKLLKKKLEQTAFDLADTNGQLEHKGYRVYCQSIQKMTYDKSVMRQVFDEDTLDLFLTPAKGKIDKYIAEHLEEYGEKSTLLRDTMIANGDPHSSVRVIKL